MVRIVLSDEQVKTLSQSNGQVEFGDSQGRHLGYFAHGWTAQDIELAQKSHASDQPRYTTEQVLAHLKSLEQR